MRYRCAIYDMKGEYFRIREFRRELRYFYA